MDLKTKCGAYVSGVALLVSATQAQQPENTASSDAPELAEIIVTAQKRSEDLQAVPISINALTSSQMQALGVTDSQDIPNLVPGLVMTKSLNIALPYLRGVGQSSATIGIESNVAVYLDGVYLSEPSAAIFSLNNVSQIAVLKGPQGTLFGRNATGGVVQVTTRDPSRDASFEGDIGFGNYQDYSGHIFATAPVSDSLSASIALGGNHQNEGYGYNEYLHEPVLSSNEANAQTKLLWTPGEDTRVLLNLLYTYSEGYEGTALGIYPGSLAENHTTTYLGPYTFDSALSGDSSTQHGLASVNIDQNLGWARLVNLAAARIERESINFTQNAIPAGTHQATDATFPSEGAESYSDEIQLQSPDTSAFPWVAGWFYFHNKSNLAADVDLDYRALFHVRSHQLTDSYALFLQGTHTVFTDTRLTLGARYTIDEKSVDGERTNAAGVVTYTYASALGALGAPTSQTWKRPTYRVALDHDFSDSTLGYVSYNRGFKSGVYNLLSLTNPAAQPETLNAYELGVKNQFWDHRVRLNVAGFYYDYTNIQLRSLVPPNPVPLLYNAAKSKIKGADVDLEVAVTSDLLFTGGVEYLNAKYDSFPDGSCAVPAPTGGNPTSILCNLDGRTMIRSPKFTSNLGVQYTLALPGSTRLRLSANDSYNSGFFWEPDNRLRQGSYEMVSASARFSFQEDRYALEFWGKNLANAVVFVNAASASSDTYAPGEPRTFGVTGSARF